MSDEETCTYSGCEANVDVTRTFLPTDEDYGFCPDHDPMDDPSLLEVWE